ncbi:MAG: PAS domain S-box protein [Bacteroidia bacterium]
MEPQRLNILVIEDNVGDFLIIQEMLNVIRDFRKDVTHVLSLQEAIDHIQKDQPDVILLDLSLPDSYGIDSFTRISNINSSIPILILSGLNDTRFAHDAVKSGAQDYLVKGEFEENLLSKSILYSIERKGSLELLRQSQASYKLLFENNPIPMYIRNMEDFSIIKVNNSAIEHFGYSEEEFLKMKVFDLHPAQELASIMNAIKQSHGISGKSSVFKHVCKNGKVRIVECRAQQIVLEGTVRMLVLADDITEKRRVQEEALFQAGVLKNVRDTIFVTDLNGNITYWNEGAEITFGYLRSEIVGKNFEILYSAIDKSKVRSEQKSVLTGELEQWDTRLISSKDEIVWTNVKGSLLHGENNEVIGVIRVCKDITESKHFSEKQKETVAMLNSIFNNVNQSILLIDKDMRLKAFNSNAVKHHIQLLGEELAENKPLSQFLLPDNLELFTEKFLESLSGNVVQWEMAYRFSPTVVYWFSINMSPVSEENGAVLGVCASLLNITERKHADETFRGQFDEIEKNNKELDKLVKILSHDLKAPMNSVSGLITLAKEVKNPEEFGQYLIMMEKSLEKLETFTNDIIASLKNRGNLVRTDVTLKSLIAEIFDELRFAPGADDIRMVNAIPDDLVIQSDVALLRSIFTNLISNAVKYRDSEKEDMYVEVNTTQYPLLLEIEIKDNGIGISAEHHSKIFDTYYTVQKRADSNGLGLSNVKNSVLKLNGNIELESKQGEGAIFRIQLPLV